MKKESAETADRAVGLWRAEPRLGKSLKHDGHDGARRSRRRACTKQPVVTLGGRWVRPRPLVGVTIIGPTSSRLIDGKLDKNTMTGTWNHGTVKGDFKIAKK